MLYEGNDLEEDELITIQFYVIKNPVLKIFTMASGSKSEPILVYPEPLSEESDMCLNRNETYTNDEKVNQYILQNMFELNHTMIITFQ